MGVNFHHFLRNFLCERPLQNFCILFEILISTFLHPHQDFKFKIYKKSSSDYDESLTLA